MIPYMIPIMIPIWSYYDPNMILLWSESDPRNNPVHNLLGKSDLDHNWDHNWDHIWLNFPNKLCTGFRDHIGSYWIILDHIVTSCMSFHCIDYDCRWTLLHYNLVIFINIWLEMSIIYWCSPPIYVLPLLRGSRYFRLDWDQIDILFVVCAYQ